MKGDSTMISLIPVVGLFVWPIKVFFGALALIPGIGIPFAWLALVL